jgi:S-formylglutathione hydrolase FrmB
MTNPPRDTECTNIPGGPQAETWLTHDVRTAVLSHFRVSTQPRMWSLMGYSTGAFCAVKLILSQPQLFADAAAFGGYYQPLTDHTTGDLFHGSKVRYDQNSPLWLYGRRGLAPGHRLLLISGQQDRDSWAQTQKLVQAARGDPAVSSLSFPTGGHNYHNYRNSMLQVLQWLARAHAFG